MRRRPLWPLIPGAIVLAVVLLGFGIWWGGHPEHLPGFLRDSALVHEHTGDRVLDQALDQIADDYYRKIPRTQIVNDSITGAVKGLDDRFSAYYDPAEQKKMDKLEASHFAGVGMRVVGVKRGLAVVSTFAGSPARRAGLRLGDYVVIVDGKRLAGHTADYATALITGKPGTKVTLTLERNGRRRRVLLTRADIKVPLVETKTYTADGKKVGWVHLDSFLTPGTHAQVSAAVRKAIAGGAKGIIFDLRGNPGGLVTEAQLTASVFIAKGAIVTTRGRHRAAQTLYATGGAIPASIPVVVLIDRGSASAAEIVAGAMRDHHRATLVGTRSFGKGVFQEVKPLVNGGSLAITAGQFFLPDGENLGGSGVTKGRTVNEGKGLKPDVYAKDNPKTKADEALRGALRVLGEKLAR